LIEISPPSFSLCRIPLAGSANRVEKRQTTQSEQEISPSSFSLRCMPLAASANHVEKGKLRNESRRFLPQAFRFAAGLKLEQQIVLKKANYAMRAGDFSLKLFAALKAFSRNDSIGLRKRGGNRAARSAALLPPKTPMQPVISNARSEA
jgi:hypothetical protein